MSYWRPNSYILVFTSNKRILTQLGLLWGVTVVFYDRYVSTDDTIDDINRVALEKGYVKNGDLVVNLAAMPVAERGMVNTIKISVVS
jgi:pyruvate kinase